MSADDDAASVPAVVARRLAAAAERQLSAWGTFATERRPHLVERIVASSAERAVQSPLDIEGSVREGMSTLVGRWAAALAGSDGPMSVQALHAAFLAVDGAHRWPDQFLETDPAPAFRDELRRALPLPLPPATPLDMPEQPL